MFHLRQLIEKKTTYVMLNKETHFVVTNLYYIKLEFNPCDAII